MAIRVLGEERTFRRAGIGAVDPRTRNLPLTALSMNSRELFGDEELATVLRRADDPPRIICE